MDYLKQCLESVFSDVNTQETILNMVCYLCDPDPIQRGHPGNRMIPSTKYGMERFITVFDGLANEFETKLI